MEIPLAEFQEDFRQKKYSVVMSATEVQDKGILEITGRVTATRKWHEECALALARMNLQAAAVLAKPAANEAQTFTLQTKPKGRKVCGFSSPCNPQATCGSFATDAGAYSTGEAGTVPPFTVQASM